MGKTVLVTGIAGQDGSYLAEYLLELGYSVFGIIRRQSTPEHQESRVSKLPIETFYGDLTDAGSLEHILKEVMPDEIYNLGAQSHVRISSDIPKYTCEVNAIGTLNMLEAYRKICPKAKFYQASSSEMFGSSVDEDGYQRETTKMNPVSPYGISKVFAYNMVRHYRKAYDLHCCNGILFNHESPRRGSNFVTNKIVKGAIRIKLGIDKNIELGYLNSYRDWGHSYDYVRAMHKIINHNQADDFVVATGITKSVRELVEYVFNKLELKHWSEYVIINPKFLRPEELKYLKGDASKIKNKLNWQPTYTFEKLIDEMIESWRQVYNVIDHPECKFFSYDNTKI